MNAAPSGGLWSSPGFVPLWFGQAASQLADRLVFVLLVELVTRQGGSPGLLGVAIAATAAPTVLFGALAGVWADRMEPRRALVLSCLARAVLVVALGLLGGLHVAAAIALATLVATAAQPFVPAEAAALPVVVAREHLTAANAIASLTMVGALVAGLVVGEPVVRSIGPEAAALGVAVAFGLAAGSLRRVATPQPAAAPRHEAPWSAQLREALAHIRSRGGLRRTMATQAALVAIAAALSVAAIVFARQALHVPYSWFMAAGGLGLGLGAWLVSRWGARWGRDAAIAGGLVAMGASLVGLAAQGDAGPAVAFGLAACAGCGAAVVGVPLQTRLQLRVAAGLRGKVFGLQNTLLNAIAIVPLAGVGFAIERFGVTAVLAGLGGLAALVGLASWGARLGED